jgi:hypothetical protein
MYQLQFPSPKKNSNVDEEPKPDPNVRKRMYRNCSSTQEERMEVNPEVNDVENTKPFQVDIIEKISQN